MQFQLFDWLSGHGMQLFQLTLSDQSIKLQDKTARLWGIFYE